MINADISLDAIARKMRGASRLLILTHDHPDGDTLGSAFALKAALGRDGRRVEVACCDPVAPSLRFITGGAADLPVPEDLDPDLICAVDMADADMLGGLRPLFDGRVDIKIDHHATSEPYAEYNYVDPGAAACGEIIYDLLAPDGAVTPEAATALYVAIASDTGCFRYANTTARTFTVTAELIGLGADSRGANHMLFERKSSGELRATGLAIDGLEFHAGTRIAVTGFTLEMKRRYDITDDDISPILGLARDVDGVEVGVTLRQESESPDVYKVSLRSDGAFDCSEVCALFGGGGHRGAAGCRIAAESFDAAKKALVDAALERLK